MMEETNIREQKNGDAVVHPKYYNAHPSGVECIDIVRHYNFNVGNAMKYLWRHGLKHEEGLSDKAKAIEDLRKAVFYIEDEIKFLEFGNEKIKTQERVVDLHFGNESIDKYILKNEQQTK